MRYIIFCLLFLSISSTAQTLPNFNVPAGYVKVDEVKGDLDKDGIDEQVYVYNSDKQDGGIGFYRALYICKVKDGKIKLWKKNATILWSSKDCGFCLEEGIELSLEIKNNTLIIAQTFKHNSRHTSTYKNIFRYQNADWFLIGSTYHNYDTCDFDFSYDINFSTKQVSVAENYGSCDDDDKKVPEDESYHFKYPFKSIPKMDGFKTGQVELHVPNAKKSFYY